MTSLKERLTEALAAVPLENTRRRDTLRAAVNAGETDAAIAAALDRLIDAREQRASSLAAAGQADLARAERDEIALLRGLCGLDTPGAGKPGGGGNRALLGMSRTQMLAGVAVLAAVAVGAYFAFRPSDDPTSALPASGEQITVFHDDHTLGNRNAPITLLEYAAPTCPYCAKFALTAMPAIKRDYIDTGKVFYIFRTYPLQGADGAVEGIARCLPAQRYFGYIERMFSAQPQWDPDGYRIPDVQGAIARLALVEGLSPARIKQCMTDETQLQRINEVAQDGWQRYSIDHTPFFVMNGVVVEVPPGQEPANVIRVRIDSLLASKS